jgi:hypothetical protein
MSAPSPEDYREPTNVGFAVHYDYGGYAFCGTVQHYRMTEREAEVTCKRCQYKLGLQEAR